MFTRNAIPSRSRAIRALSLAACLMAAASLHKPAVAACPPTCLASVTVVGAAGIPDLMKTTLENVRFQGPEVARDSAAELNRVIASSPRLPDGTVLKLSVSADAGMSRSAAEAQIDGRIKSLDAALRQAGLPNKQYTINAR